MKNLKDKLHPRFYNKVKWRVTEQVNNQIYWKINWEVLTNIQEELDGERVLK